MAHDSLMGNVSLGSSGILVIIRDNGPESQETGAGRKHLRFGDKDFNKSGMIAAELFVFLFVFLDTVRPPEISFFDNWKIANSSGSS
jgi:hypothetical protein